MHLFMDRSWIAPHNRGDIPAKEIRKKRLSGSSPLDAGYCRWMVRWREWMSRFAGAGMDG
jgi:hypothetical protein